MRARIPVCTAWRQKTETQVREVSVRFISRSKNQEMPQASSPLFQTESPRTTQLISTGGKKRLGSCSLTQAQQQLCLLPTAKALQLYLFPAYLTPTYGRARSQFKVYVRKIFKIKKKKKTTTSFQRSRLLGIPVSVLLKHLMTGIDSKQLLNSR